MYNTTGVRPTAHIAISNNRVSHKNQRGDRTVYFPNSTEFQIELTNNHTGTVLAMITVNGKAIGSSGLVLRPGEHIYLDRFIDDAKKFLFDIYEVDDNSAVKKAIQYNGIVKVEFFKEQEVIPIRTTTWVSPPSIFYCNTGGSLIGGAGDGAGGAGNWSKTYDSATSYANSSVTYTADSVMSVGTSRGTLRSLMTDAPSKADFNTMETGRVEQGGNSNQQFTTVNKQFESFAFHTETIKILPSSCSTSHITVYCSDCGRRFRKTEKYCSRCGLRK